MNKNRKYTDTQISKASDLQKSGLSYKKISKQMSIPVSSLSYLLRKRDATNTSTQAAKNVAFEHDIFVDQVKGVLSLHIRPETKIAVLADMVNAP